MASTGEHAPVDTTSSSGKPDDKETIDKLRQYLTSKAEYTKHRSRCLFEPENAALTLGPYATLELDVVEGRNLFVRPVGFIERMAGDIPDAYVKVFNNDVPVMDKDGQPIRTKTVRDDVQPTWNFSTKVDVVVPSSIIRVHVYDSDPTSASDPLGFVEIQLSDLPWDETIDGWFELCFPEALQGKNIDRLAKHKEKRYEDMHKEEEVERARQKEASTLHMSQREHAAAAAKTQVAAGAATPLLADEAGGQEEAGAPKSVLTTAKSMVPLPTGGSRRIARMFKSFKDTAGEALKEAKDGAAHAAHFGFDLAARVVTSPLSKKKEEVHHNAGEIHLRFKLVKLGTFTDAAIALTMDANCTDFVSFVQNEELPQMDLQEVVDDIMDIKLKVFDDMIVSTLIYIWYILCWRSKLISLLVFAMFGIDFFVSTFELREHAALPHIVWHVGLMILLALNSLPGLRQDMTTGALNAPCNQEGFVRVARWNNTQQMNNFLQRCIAARQGIIKNEQELFEFAGMCFQYGETLCTMEQLMQVLATTSFVSLPAKGSPAEDALVYVDERRRATVEAVLEDDMVRVEMDADAIVSHKAAHEEIVAAWRVTQRLDVPPVPRMFVPQNVQTTIRMAGLQVDVAKKQIIPIADRIAAVCTWKDSKITLAIMAYLAIRTFFHAMDYYGNYYVHAIFVVILETRNVIYSIIFLLVACGQARIFQVMINLAIMLVRLVVLQRKAPEGWAFYRPVGRAPREPPARSGSAVAAGAGPAPNGSAEP